MPAPRASSAYPASLLAALHHAMDTGEIFIPCPPSEGIKPNNLRLQFYGLLSALKREGQPELGEALTLTLSNDPPGIRVAWRDTGKIGALVAAALQAAGASTDEAESAFFSKLTAEGEKS